jgi:hypothetical protein
VLASPFLTQPIQDRIKNFLYNSVSSINHLCYTGIQMNGSSRVIQASEMNPSAFIWQGTKLVYS